MKDKSNRIFNEDKIEKLFQKNKDLALEQLKDLAIYCDNSNNIIIPGLNGWLYEQTIQYCIRKELKNKGLKATIVEQAKLDSRKKVDLQINDNIAIEVKYTGLFHPKDIDKYKENKKTSNKNKVTYLFLSGWEGSNNYRKRIKSSLGKNNAFYIDEEGEWNRFMNTIESLL